MADTAAERSTAPERSPSQEELIADIEQTREQLGDTVDALARKIDVKAQAKARADATKRRLRQQVTSIQAIGRRAGTKAKDVTTDHDGQVEPPFPLLAVSAVVLLIAVVAIRRRQR